MKLFKSIKEHFKKKKEQYKKQTEEERKRLKEEEEFFKSPEIRDLRGKEYIKHMQSFNCKTKTVFPEFIRMGRYNFDYETSNIKIKFTKDGFIATIPKKMIIKGSKKNIRGRKLTSYTRPYYYGFDIFGKVSTKKITK